ncbi:DUF5812 family protein [Halorientalis pallida]|uniref:Uncharacterized protein n=1 Tax=Halorientalis pallida TaxID=2479928 RepID=A0A498KZC9_9EURY|nr:DUF5812 family protein [Halorientalis pallida]RXK47403.1 hypothetical protein EAF64_16635 [Halorientalis pallida]
MKDATFLVTAADDESAVLQDVTDSQVHTLSTNPGVEVGETVVATIEPEPPMEVVWQVVEITDQRTIPVERSPEPPTQQTREIAADQPVGEITRQERAGEGELHVITVPDGEADDAAEDVLDDAETLARAARLGVDRVEIRADGQALSVRYLP